MSMAKVRTNVVPLRAVKPEDVPLIPVAERQSIEELAENGHADYAWRMLNGVPTLVTVCVGFTISGLDREEFEGFRERMLRFGKTLGALGYPVVTLKFQRRKAQGKRHWAEFVCETPETDLPAAPRPPRR